MAYRYGNRDQITFLPDSIENYVTEEDPVRVYDAFVDALDLESLGIKVDDKAVGNSSYNPVTMIKILIYGYSYGWRSSRKLERALHHNLSFIWLAAGLKPDHKTIANFRKDHKEPLKQILTQCARLCVKLDLIEGNTLFVDGSKFRANAGKSQSKRVDKWERYRTHVEKRIEELLEECQKVDETEKESLVKINKELSNRRSLKAKIDQLLTEMEPDAETENEDSSKNQSKSNSINGTDPDCKIMKGRQGSHACYNSQLVTDDEHGLAVSLQASTAMNDLNELSKQVEQAEEILEKPAKTVCADAGYSSVDDLKPLVDEGKTLIVPNNEQAKKEVKDDPFGKSTFRYDQQTDTYTCPAGQLLHRYSYETARNRYIYRTKAPSTCLSCVHFGTCTSSKIGRGLYRLTNQEVKDSIAQIYESEEGQRIYAQRKMKVEHPFGHIKRNLGAGTFLLRGLSGVNAELSLLATSFNLARMITILGGVKPLVQELRKVQIT